MRYDLMMNLPGLDDARITWLRSLSDERLLALRGPRGGKPGKMVKTEIKRRGLEVK